MTIRALGRFDMGCAKRTGNSRHFVPRQWHCLLSTLAALLLLCGAAAPSHAQTSYTLTVSKGGTGSGTVTAVVGASTLINCGPTCPSASAAVPAGATVTLTASTPSFDNNIFNSWSGACSGTSRTCTVTANGPMAVSAQFTFYPYSIDVTKAGSGKGTVSYGSSSICDPNCTRIKSFYLSVTTVTLTAMAESGSSFAGWAGSGCSGTAPCTVTVDAQKAVTATFSTAATFPLTVSKAGTGSGSVTSSPGGINCGTTCTQASASFPAGSTVTLTASAVAGPNGSTFAGWSGGGCSGTGPCAVTMNAATAVTATFSSAPVATPVFPITVTSNITASTATASAAVQFRPQDIGRTGNVYVFAVAPASQVKSDDMAMAQYVGDAWAPPGKADPPTPCVLAQLSTTGQLVAVTYAQLQASLSGTFSAQGASVSILNNVSTPTVAGATFYVGYGASGIAMIDEGVYRSALTVPGTGVCPMPSSQTALWWNPAESGWGVNLNHQGNILFGTLFTYDASGVPLWLVMSAGAMQSDGVTFLGDLYRTTGPAFNANPFTPIGAANLTQVGTMTASFIDVNGGTLRYTVNGVEVAKAIQRQVFGSRAASCLPTTASRATATNYQDLWWNAAESGWGINVTHQDNTLFATLFTYDATGRNLWLVMSAGTRQADGSYLGDLYRTSGPAFNAVPFTGVGVATVGTMRLRFSDGNNGTLTYTYNGATVTKAITRQVFSSPVPGCS